MAGLVILYIYSIFPLCLSLPESSFCHSSVAGEEGARGEILITWLAAAPQLLDNAKQDFHRAVPREKPRSANIDPMLWLRIYPVLCHPRQLVWEFVYLISSSYTTAVEEGKEMRLE